MVPLKQRSRYTTSTAHFQFVDLDPQESDSMASEVGLSSLATNVSSVAFDKLCYRSEQCLNFFACPTLEQNKNKQRRCFSFGPGIDSIRQ